MNKAHPSESSWFRVIQKLELDAIGDPVFVLHLDQAQRHSVRLRQRVRPFVHQFGAIGREIQLVPVGIQDGYRRLDGFRLLYASHQFLPVWMPVLPMAALRSD